MDDNIWNATRITTFEYSQLTFSMGRKFNGVSTISNFGNYSNLYPLYGQIEMLATRAAYCEFLTLKELKDELFGLTKVNEFDEFGMLKKTEVHQAGKTILSNTYAYKTRSDSKYLSKQISSETIKVGNQSFTRNYTTDALGNLTSISDSTFGNHSYEYDYRGFLTKADGEECEYDGNGNITRKGSINFVYDNVIKDRLVSVNGLAISYDSSNPLNPTKYGSKWFTFEGRRLTRLTLTSGYYDYKYNDQGLRIQKKDYRGITWDYTYDGDKLIYESSPYGKLNFLYDENNMLYGFIKDNTEKYLYIRDNLQNIIAITTLSGEIVVKYAYDAWGKLLSTMGSLASTIGALNPFKYKGYYYDQESGMYYCKSRYYVPDWCRWLNADSSTNLSFLNYTINLLCYCNNNPISGYDSNGDIPKWLSITLKCVATAAIVVAACAISVATAGSAAPVIIGVAIGVVTTGIKDIADDGKLNSGLDAYLGAAVSGAIAGLGAGLGTTALSSGLGDVVGGVFDGSIKSFSDGCIAFASGAVLGAIGYGISNGISKGLARRKLNKIVPNWNAKNGKINKQLANAGYKNLKIGRDGYNKIFDTVYKDSGYDILNKGISYAYDFITSLF